MRQTFGPRTAPGSTWTTPFDTTEVRWFATGTLPGSVSKWFRDSGPAPIVETRRDTYWMQASHDVGLKSRNNGPLEIKLCLSRSGDFDLGEGILGHIEEWRKAPLKTLHEVNGSAHWRWSEVHKRVVTRTYGPDVNGRLVPIVTTDLPPTGCDIELATVSVGDTLAWTFAFEAWGPRERRLELLDGSWRAFRQNASLPPIELGRLGISAGYPEWLATVAWQGEVLEGAPAGRSTPLRAC